LPLPSSKSQHLKTIGDRLTRVHRQE